ncbi:putative zinc-binding metallopeptidase [bacterium]|nr:putative zinc-binding metallopeptidase [bacterium]
MHANPSDNPRWANYPDEDLLNLKFCDLKLTIEGTSLEMCIARLFNELKSKELSFLPPIYLGDEWFSPDKSPAIAIPFYLAHPRLKQLERKMMLEVEGESEEECMKLLRHETGHAFCHAFSLPRRRTWRTVFGSPSEEYSDFYHYQPYSRRYVRHLENWYAQSHPEEDFAETFAVWLAPNQDWKKLYSGWPAYKKLIYVDTLMRDLKGKPSPKIKTEKPFHIRTLKKKLKTHYEQRKKCYAEDDPAFFDSDLRHIFLPVQAEDPRGISGARFLRRHRADFLKVIPFWTRERKFTVNRLIKKLANRCDALKLFVPKNEEKARLEIASYLTALVSNYLFTGRFKGHL